MKNILIIFFTLSFFPFLAEANDFSKRLDDAHQLYFNKQFEEAKNQYLKLIEKGYVSGHIFYNLGNIAYQQNKLGEVIFYYEKASRLIPRDQDLRANLHFIKTKLTHQIPVDKPISKIFKTLFFWNSYLTIKELLTLVILANAFFWAFLILYFLKKKVMIKSVLVFSLVIFLLLGISMGFKYFYDFKKIWGIVLKPEIEVYPSFLETDKVLFKLHEGNKVGIQKNKSLGTESKWIQIVLSDKKRGWVNRDDIGQI